jgi:hypothetical protein
MGRSPGVISVSVPFKLDEEKDVESLQECGLHGETAQSEG